MMKKKRIMIAAALAAAVICTAGLTACVDARGTLSNGWDVEKVRPVKLYGLDLKSIKTPDGTPSGFFYREWRVESGE